MLHLAWDYTGRSRSKQLDSSLVAREINGYFLEDVRIKGQDFKKGDLVPSFAFLQDNGATSSGNWLYCGSFTEKGNMMARRSREDSSGIGLYPHWAWCWPVNRRILYNRASVDARGRPWDPEHPVIQWKNGQWIGDVPDGGWPSMQQADGTWNPQTRKAFIMKPDGVAGLFGPGRRDGPFPEHYEPLESPLFRNPLPGNNRRINPLLTRYSRVMERRGDLETWANADPRFPYVCTTYRVTEHWQTGVMTAQRFHAVPFFTPATWLLLFLTGIGLLAALYRLSFGLGPATNLNDGTPWGLWITFDVMTGVALAAGGFTITGAVYILNWKKYKPITRSATLTAFIGYLLVMIGLVLDIGKPWSFWHAWIFWQPHSVMFEIVICMTLYSLVLFLEFLPPLLEGINKLKGLGRGTAWMLLLACAARFMDIRLRGHLPLIVDGSATSILFLLEFLVLGLAPMVLLFSRRVRTSVRGLILCQSLVLMGVILYRFDVVFLAQKGSGGSYFPSWIEIAVSIGLVAGGVLGYRFCVTYLPVFATTPDSPSP